MRCAVAALCVILAGGAASAQSGPLREAYDQGLAAFQARDYETALRRFQRAYELSRSPEFLFNIGLTLERLGRRQEAVAAFQRFLELEPASPQRAVVERRLAALHEAPVATPPTPPPVPVVTPVAVRPVIAPPPPTPRARPAWPWVVLGAGVAVGATGVVVAVTASDPGADPAVRTEAQYVDATGALETRRVISGVLMGVGGAALVAGLVGLVVSRPSREAAGVQAFATPITGGAVAGVVVRAF